MEAVRQRSYDMGVNVMGNPMTNTQLLNPNWKMQPMRAWDDVYEDLCREVGLSYGILLADVKCKPLAPTA